MLSLCLPSFYIISATAAGDPLTSRKPAVVVGTSRRPAMAAATCRRPAIAAGTSRRPAMAAGRCHQQEASHGCWQMPLAGGASGCKLTLVVRDWSDGIQVWACTWCGRGWGAPGVSVAGVHQVWVWLACTRCGCGWRAPGVDVAGVHRV